MKTNYGKKGLFLLFFLMLALIIAGCGEESKKDSQTDSKTAKKGKMVIGVEENAPPLQWSENGEAKGYCAEIAKEALNRIGYDVELKFMTVQATIDAAKKGEVDAIMPYYKTAEREAFLTYSKDFICQDPLMLFVKADSNINYDGKIETLKKYKIGVVKGYSYGEELDKAIKNGEVKVDVSETSDQNEQKLLDGKVDAAIDVKFMALYFLKKNNKTGALKELNPPIKISDAYLAFSKAKNIDPNVIAEYEKALAEMKKDGTWQRILDKYTK